MAVAMRAGLRSAPRVNRSVLSLNSLSFNERDVQQGEALINEHFRPVVHPNEEMNERIREMARLYVQQNGAQLMDFMRENQFLPVEDENHDETVLAEAEELEDENEIQATWSIKALLQWVWNKVSLAEDEEQPLPEEREERESRFEEITEEGDYFPTLLQSTVSLAILITFAVILTRVRR